MKIIGLTGPTGSGKSTVAAVAEKLGFAVIDCDKLSRLATEKGSDGLAALVSVFGEEILFADGNLNRKKLAEIAFSDKNETDKLNKTLLPYILDIIKLRIGLLSKGGAEKILLDAPTLYESGADVLCDSVIAVLSDSTLRRERILCRDSLTECDADTRLAASKSDSFYLERTNNVLYNNSDKESFVNKALDMLKSV